jgi:hypothetical protein
MFRGLVMDMRDPDATAIEPETSLLLSVEPLPAAQDRDAAGGRMTDNDGNDR